MITRPGFTVSKMCKQTKLLLFGCLLISGSLKAQQLPKVPCGKMERLQNFPSKYVVPRNVDIWLPPGYSSEKKYAVLYMQDGQMLFDTTATWNHQSWHVAETMCRLLANQQIRDCIVVGVWNTPLRHTEYFPQKAFYSMTPADQQKILAVGKEKGKALFGNGPLSDNYLQFLVKELKPYIDHHYFTLKDLQNTFIAGSSMGGLVSMYAICKYPDVFGGAACLSTHWPGIFTTADNPIPEALLQYLKTNLPSPKDHQLYFDYGSKNLDALYKPYQLQADTILRNAGYDRYNWLTREFPGDDHSENSWATRLAIPLVFLLKR